MAVTYKAALDDVDMLHVYSIKGNVSRCGVKLGEPDVLMHDTTNVEVARLLKDYRKGCYNCLTDLMGLPTEQNPRKRARL